MENRLFFLFFLTFNIWSVSAETHVLQYFHTAVTSGINIPEFSIVGLVDGEELEYYDSSISKFIPKTDWIKKNTDNDDPMYWNRNTQKAQGNQDNFKTDLNTIMERYNHTEGVHTFQWMYGCELDDDGTVRGYNQFGYDGEDFISLDLKTLTWTAANNKAFSTKKKWESTGVQAGFQKNYLENICIDWLKKCVSYGRETLERKDPPTVHAFQQQSSSPGLVCHATGFFPKGVMMSWQKDGEEVEDDVDLRETLPNQDGSFQKRIILRVSPEDLKKHKYTCVIQHSSLKEELKVVPRDRGRVSGGDQTGIIISVVVLLVLCLVVVGIVVWKKKKRSGFKPVPSKPSSEGDSVSSGSETGSVWTE